MIVYCNFSITNAINPKQITLYEFVGGMIYYFQNLCFGEGVKEIVYFVISGDEEYLSHFGVGTSYGRRYKTLGTIFTVDHKTLQSLEGEDLFDFISQQVINQSRKFADKKIKNFNLEEYINNLEKYFSEAMQIMREGRSPAEGKVLNEDIQYAMAKKFSKL